MPRSVQVTAKKKPINADIVAEEAECDRAS
jgi:hypothetical protein